MSETEEPPTKVLKTQEDEAALSDTTAVSNLSDTSMTGDTMDLPETTLPEVTDLPEVPELPGVPDLQGVTDLPRVTDLPEATDLPAAQESLETAENVSMEGTEMVEERLQDSVESEEAAESQEEWLSEGILTDDDFNHTDSQSSQPEASVKQEQVTTPIPAPAKPEAVEQNIEDALNTLEGGPEKDEMNEYDFLIKKTNEEANATKANNENVKEEADDGNDTDDLLRMLGDDGSKTKKLTKTVKDVRSAAKGASSDDDDYVFEGAAKKLKLSKAIGKALKEEPKDMDGSDQTSDEAETLQKMFSNKKSNKPRPNTKPVQYQETQAKSIISVIERPRKDKLATSTPLPNRARSLLKTPQVETTVQLKREPQHNTYSRKPQNNKISTPLKGSSILKTVKEKKEEESTHEEFLDENDEEFESDYSEENRKLSRSHTELDDGSEGDSRSEDGSLYDELPSSGSDDAEDWFQLDIRAEKAGDYLPLLGQKAKQLLLEEKKRVGERLANLKSSLSALTDSGKKQAEEVRTATMTLAELDDMLKAS